MRVGALVVAAVCLAACTRTAMVDASVVYARTTEVVTAELRFAPDLAAEVCRKRAEVAFFVAASTDPATSGSFAEFYRRAGAPETPGVSWATRCQAAELLADTVAQLVDHVGTYAYTLDAAATKKVAIGDTVETVVGGIGGVVSLGTSAGLQLLSSVVDGAAKPLGFLANQVAGSWKADKLGELVTRADPEVRTIAITVIRFLDTLERTELAALDAEIRAVHALAAPAGTRDAAIRYEVELARYLERVRARLAAAERLANDVASSHRELVWGWAHGAAAELTTDDAMSTFSRTANDDLHGWRTDK